MPIRDWKIQYRTIYDILYETPRVPLVSIEKAVGKTARRRLKEAVELQYILGPELRKRCYENLKEYVYFLNCKDPEIPYIRYREDPSVIYHAEMIGFSNLLLITRKKIDIEGDIILEGYRSDYHFSFAPNHSWETALERMRKKIETFDPRTYLPKGIIQTHFDEAIEWGKEDELLYRYFKYSLREPVSPVMKENEISKDKIYQFLDRLLETCTIATSYYPNRLPEYDPYLFMLETEYEDFIIDLFSEFPTTSYFFKILDKLFVYVLVPDEIIRPTDLKVTIKKLHIPLLLIDLQERGIIESKERAMIEYSKGKAL